ncbi:MAG TPA: DoxX family protein, partial [Acidobacteriota bacterium]|nr:DoxX family protein [Acidobacteriota bacterium]
ETLPPKLVAFDAGLRSSGYLFELIKGTETAMGVLLLLNRFVPLALVILAPIVLNIVLVHLLLAPSGLPIAVVVLALELYLAWVHRRAFAPLLRARFA